MKKNLAFSFHLSRRLHTLIVSIFKYSLAKGYIKEPDIVVRLTWYKEQMPKAKAQSLYSEELSPDEIGTLLSSIYATRHSWTLPVSVALQLAPYCVVRLLGRQNYLVRVGANLTLIILNGLSLLSA